MHVFTNGCFRYIFGILYLGITKDSLYCTVIFLQILENSIESLTDTDINVTIQPEEYNHVS